MTFIHQQDPWPNFSWNHEKIAAPLAAVRHKQGKLLGRMEALGFELRTEASLTALTNEVVKSSAIEGEQLSPQEVRSSLARRLGLETAGLPVASRSVDGIVEMMLNATQQYDSPLSDDRLFGWHAALFPTGRSGMRNITVGAWRPREAGPMQVVSGPIGREKVHFEAPEASRLDFEMSLFIEWFNTNAATDPVLKAGIAHLWFVAVHPFEDGNGRIARAIADMALTRADGTKERFYSMSSQIETERRAYYDELESAQKGSLDITQWLSWFLGCLDRAMDQAGEATSSVLRKAKVWEKLNLAPVNERQRIIVNRLLDGFHGHLTTSKYATITKCSQDTAHRDIQDLVQRGVVVQNPGGGRSTSYRIAETMDD